MSLVLTRKINEAVRVGSRTVTITRVGRANVNVMTDSPRRVHSCAIGDIVILEPGVTVVVTGISKGCARLAFDAPLSVKIVRTELESDDNS